MKLLWQTTLGHPVPGLQADILSALERGQDVQKALD